MWNRYVKGESDAARRNSMDAQFFLNGLHGEGAHVDTATVFDGMDWQQAGEKKGGLSAYSLGVIIPYELLAIFHAGCFGG